MNYPEDKLKLLAKPLSFQTRNSFIIHVNMLYEPYIHSKKPPAPKGKTLQTPTKTRSGRYKITYLTKEIMFTFEKTKNGKEFPMGLEKRICKDIEIDPELLKEFLKKKNFHLTG